MEFKNNLKNDLVTNTKIIDKQLLDISEEVKFCTKCVVSNQRPRIQFDDNGVCSACQFAYEKNNKINWKEREEMLRKLCDKHRKNDGSYDVIVPCSGGKDASMIAHKLKHKYGMHPLTVTWAPFEYTEIGWKNFRNFIKSGFNNLLASPNGKLHRKLARLSFELVGDSFLPFIYGQTVYAFHIASKFDIKLVFFGENGEAEYGGDPKNNYKSGMPIENWVESYFKGITVDELIKHGLEKTDYITKEDYDESDLMFYRAPPLKELKEKEIEFHWFSFYEKWIPQENYYYCSENTGFEANPEGRSEGTYSKYASLDDQMDGFHYYLGFLKFGIGRTTSDSAHEIRDGHITREEAVALVQKYDGEFPKRYFKEFLAYLDITEDHFWEVLERFRSPHLWNKIDGEWKLKTVVGNN
jgi:N-acetyl sugar amidotransferase